MSNLVLHIGHGKTGSSFIQSVLALNIKQLSKYGINYPKPSDINKAKKGYINSGNGHKLLDSNQNFLFEKNFNIFKDKITLYSDETFIRRLIFNNQFKDFIAKNHNKLKVILYTRNFFEHEFSTWGQLVKRHYFKNDLNNYLKNNQPSGVYKLITDWINLSKLFNFELIIKNYSNYKDKIFDIFLDDVLGFQASNLELRFPKAPVNRSLTFTEYEIIRVLNKFRFEENLSDNLINFFPQVKPMKLFCSLESYKIARKKNIKNIEYINDFIPKKERIIFEDPSEVSISKNNNQDEFLSDFESNLIADFIIRNFSLEKKELLDKNNALMPSKQINHLRNIALKIENNEQLELKDALSIMNVAIKLRPNSKFMENKSKTWFKKIKNQK